MPVSRSMGRREKAAIPRISGQKVDERMKVVVGGAKQSQTSEVTGMRFGLLFV